MRNFLQILLIILSEILSFFNKFIPKSDKKILFFSNPSYNDNARALLQWSVENLPQGKYSFYSCVKISTNGEKNNIKFISRVKGLFVFLRAKYVFYDIGTTRIRPSEKQMVVQLWHGTPLKMIGRSVSKIKKQERLDDFSFVITTSEKFLKVFALAFECDEKKVRLFEYPRNDYLLKPDFSILQNYQNKVYKKNILWMPTFRKSFLDKNTGVNTFSLPYFEDMKGLEDLNEYLRNNDSFLTVKLHPADISNSLSFPFFSNIKIFNIQEYNSYNIPNYSFVSCFDMLITDYSSIYFDWLLLDRPMAFTINDLAEYSSQRGFIFENPLEYMPGEIIRSTDQFYEVLDRIINNIDNFSVDRKRLRDYSHSVNWNGDACEQIMNYLGIK